MTWWSVVAAMAISPVESVPNPGPGAGPPLCNLTGHWRWGSAPLDIAIVMTTTNAFEVSLHPDQDWHNATGRFQQLYNGTAVVEMVGAPGTRW